MSASKALTTSAALYYAKRNNKSLAEAAETIKEINDRYEKYKDLISEFRTAWTSIT